MPVIVWVAAGGALGSALRYLVNVWSARALGMAFPWHTLSVNVVGSFIMGLAVALMAPKLGASLEIRAFATTGILGGFTTFSAFSLDFAMLVERQSYGLAGTYAAGSVLLSLAAVFAGLSFARALFP